MISTNSSSNSKNGCLTTTSECVVWQGPNIDCIDLCTGDTISTVIATLAQELCDLIESVQVNGNVQCIKDWATDHALEDHFNLMYEMICAALACCDKEDRPTHDDPGHGHSSSSMPAGTREQGLAEISDDEYNKLLAEGAEIKILT